MPFLRLYYDLKPFLPVGLRNTLRRWSVLRQLEGCHGTWPISESAARVPEGWPGWPQGKFAMVITHDVEGQVGVDKCRRLLELEKSLGFRSSFNFVPEGEYRVPPGLRALIQGQGFEVGVHDLNHDGKLYRSREGFSGRAARINRHLKEWGAAGFRSAYMMRRLDWLHELDVLYDASTFDTDPFEPEPDGCNTIFPFRVNAGNGRSYVELPYTLPQDSTLFLHLREQTWDIWKRKLDWVAKHGGMALLNVHPDYLCFEGEAPKARTFPVEFYAGFLKYVRDQYAGDYWQPLPREVAQFCVDARIVSHTGEEAEALGRSRSAPAEPVAKSENPPAANPAPSPPGQTFRTAAARILMLVENNYPQDTRVRNEAMLLAGAGHEVSVICLKKPGQTATEVVQGVRVYRLPRIELFNKTGGENPSLLGLVYLKAKSYLGYVVEYTYFTSACLLVAAYHWCRRGFDVIHAHNPPDTLFAVALPFKLLGKKFVFDHHDLSPELYMSRYGSQGGILGRMLLVTEWCSLKLANLTIATNESYKQAQIQRAGKDPRTIFIVRNGPAQSKMTPVAPSPRLRQMNKCILCYIGSLNPQDGVDYLLRSLGKLVRELKRTDFHCVIMGSGDSLADLRKLCSDLRLDGCVELTGFISEQDLLANLAAADICVDPDPSSPLNDVSTWIKIMEYMAYSKPIVSFDLKETRYSAQEAALFVPPNDELAFAQAIVQLMDNPELRRKMGEFGRQRVEQHLQWSVVGQNLLAAYASLR